MPMNILKFLENTNYTIAYLLPISIIAGSFLADLSISLIGIIFVIISIIKKKFQYFFSTPIIFFWIWCIYLLFNSLFSNNILLSLESSLFYFRFGLFTLGIWYILDNNHNFKKNFLFILICIFIILFFDGFLEFFYGTNLLNHEYDNHRIQSFFGDNQVIGSYLARLLPLMFALFYSEFPKTNKSIFFFMFLLIGTDLLVYLSGERTSFFIVGMVSICIIVLTSKYRLIRLATFLISVSLILLVTYNKDNIKERMIDHTIQQTNILEENSNIFSERHESFYRTSFNIFIDNPLFGIGPKLYREYCDDKNYSVGKSCSSHPHNTYMQLLAETGIVGALPVIFLFFYICYVFIRQIYSNYFTKHKFYDDHLICLYIALFVTVWPFMPSQNIFNNWTSILYYLPIGFILYEHSRINKNK